jgi:hypothetical protein
MALKARWLVVAVGFSLAGATTLWAAVAARGSTTSLHVNPARVSAGAQVRVFGNADGCPRGDQVTLLSRAFSHAHEFAGVSAVFATVKRGGAFSTFTRIPVGRAAGRYVISARCGGGNLGVTAHLTVLAPVSRGFTG